MLSARGSIVGHGALSPAGSTTRSTPSLAGIPLKYLSLVTLTVQNSLLTILLHYSRISVSAEDAYSPASAVLVNELLKGTISTIIAFKGAWESVSGPTDATQSEREKLIREGKVVDPAHGSLETTRAALSLLRSEVFRFGSGLQALAEFSDAFKLSIPAALYVIQNNLQFVAASNLDVPTFQVTYNLKILTTAVFSVIMLRRKLSGQKWLALFALAAGVAIVQLQSTAATGHGGSGNSMGHEMNRLKGLVAVASACTTSGLAGVYFELVLKGSTTDLWIRNVQLSLFSLVPALFPVYFPHISLFSPGPSAPSSTKSSGGLLANFGFWAWAVVLCQVVGGLVTAVVIKYSDNILKGFATSLAIIISFCAGIVLFDFQMTLSFFVGASIVIGATYLYNLPDGTVDRRQSLHHASSSSPPGPGRRPFVSSKPIPPSSSYFGRSSPSSKSGSSSIRDFKLSSSLSGGSSSSGGRGLTSLRPNSIPKRDAHTPEVNLDMPSFSSTSTPAVDLVSSESAASMASSAAAADRRSHDFSSSGGHHQHKHQTSQQLKGRNGSITASPVVDYGATDGISMVDEPFHQHHQHHHQQQQKRTY